MISSAGFFNENSMIVAWRFRIQDFKRKKGFKKYENTISKKYN